MAQIHHNTTARFIANGELSESFPIHRGIRQGCPLAAFLFLLVMEPLAPAIQDQAAQIGFVFQVEGRVQSRAFSGFVDDSALFLRAGSKLQDVLLMLDHFAKASGLHVNRAKSHGIWLHRRLRMDSYEGIPFLVDGATTRYLGVQVGLGDLTAPNWDFRIRKLSNRLRFAERRDLSLLDRATVIRTIALASILFTARFYYPPTTVLDQIQRMLTRFLWSGTTTETPGRRRAPITHEITALLFDDGGLNVPNVAHAIQEQACKRVLQWATGHNDFNMLILDLRVPGENEHRADSTLFETKNRIPNCGPDSRPPFSHQVPTPPTGRLASAWSRSIRVQSGSLRPLGLRQLAPGPSGWTRATTRRCSIARRVLKDVLSFRNGSRRGTSMRRERTVSSPAACVFSCSTST